MNDTEAFLRKIRENPDDDAPRLVFADYLDEQALSSSGKDAKDQERWAKIIRAQIAAERDSYADASFWNKWEGLDLSVPGKLARQIVPKPCRAQMVGSISRGFYDQIDTSAGRLAQIGDLIMESVAPVRKLDLSLFEEDWSRIKENPVLGLVRELVISNYGFFNEKILKGICEDSQLQSLAVLHLPTLNSYDFDCLPTLKKCKNFPALKELIGSFFDLDDYREFLKYPLTSKLEMLAGKNTSVQCAELYSHAPLAKTVTYIEVDDVKADAPSKTTWGKFSNLQRLGLEMTGKRDWVTPFLESQTFPHLTRLDLWGKTLPANVLSYFESGEGELLLVLHKLNRSQLNGILSSPTMKRVKAIEMDGKSVEHGIEILSQNESATNLRSLKIEPENGIKKPIPFFKCLAKSPVFANLLHLETPMSFNYSSLKQLAESAIGQSLRALITGRPQLTDKWQAFLRSSKNFPALMHFSLVRLELDDNLIAKGRKKLKI